MYEISKTTMTLTIEHNIKYNLITKNTLVSQNI